MNSVVVEIFLFTHIALFGLPKAKLLPKDSIALGDVGAHKSFTLDAIMHGVRLKQQLVLRALLYRDLNQPNENGDTPLLCAIKEGRPLYEIELLIQSGAILDEYKMTGDTPLICAILNDRKYLIEALIRDVGGVNLIGSDGDTALMCAIIKGDLSVVKTLITAGADLDARRDNGDTVLMACVMLYKSTRKDILEQLLHAPIKPDLDAYNQKTGYNLLQLTTDLECTDLIKYFIHHGADEHAPRKIKTLAQKQQEALEAEQAQTLKIACMKEHDDLDSYVHDLKEYSQDPADEYVESLAEYAQDSQAAFLTAVMNTKKKEKLHDKKRSFYRRTLENVVGYVWNSIERGCD